MKKNFLMIIVFGFISFSCSTQATKQNLSAQINLAIGEKLYAEVSGNLYVRKTAGNSLLILCNTDKNSEKFYDKSLLVFSETDIPKLEFSNQDNYEIKIPESRKYAVIYNTTKNKIHFIGISDQAKEIENLKKNTKISKAISNNDYLGYGFSFMNNKWDAGKIEEAKYKNPFNILDYANYYNADKKLPLLSTEDEDEGLGGADCKEGACTSGGNGSSSCSISEPLPSQSCTVTCNAGFYACCKSSTVSCYCCKY